MKRVLLLGVNPFEDLPGYQLLSALKSDPTVRLVAADDSEAAITVLEQLGTRIVQLPHPSNDFSGYAKRVLEVAEEEGVDIILPAGDIHLWALAHGSAESRQLDRFYPPLKWLRAHGLANKWDIQEWLRGQVLTPTRSRFSSGTDLGKWELHNSYPVMVKGVRKGAVKCADSLEAIVGRRLLLSSPANQGIGGGAYLESHVEGSEHSILLFLDADGAFRHVVALQKLAANASGTTQCARLEDPPPLEDLLGARLEELHAPSVLEVEWKRSQDGRIWVFEINLRFPAWIGALEAFGRQVVKDFLGAMLGQDLPRRRSRPPPPGTIFYRLPESGLLNVPEVFGNSDGSLVRKNKVAPRANSLLWNSGSPHRFLSK